MRGGGASGDVVEAVIFRPFITDPGGGMRIQRVLMPGSGAESWTVLGDDCPYGESGSCHRILISPGVERHRQDPRLLASPIPAARSSRRPATLFGTIPDPAEHPLGHHEGDHRNGLDQQRRPLLGVSVALAHQQPGRPVRLLP